jgi:hypothetical protein
MIPTQRIVAVDWSGDKSASGQRRKIWAGVWTASNRPTANQPAAKQGKVDGGTVTLEAGRTRDELATWLIALAAETPRMVVGFDFCFSFPAWFVLDELGCAHAPAFWSLVAGGHGERWLATGCDDRRFWGKPSPGNSGKRPAEFSGDQLHRMLRATDIDCKIVALIPEAERAARVKGITPKSVFQVGGAGSVGTASLRGVPILLRLREAGFAIWPFDKPALATAKPLAVEIYTRLNSGPVHKANPLARAAYLLAKRQQDPAYAALPRAVLAQARASEDAFDALVSCMTMTAHRHEFASLPVPRDPNHSIEGWTWAPGV